MLAFVGFQIISKSTQNQKFKRDYAELNHFRYGLFSVDAWKEQLSVIIADEIDKLYLTRSNEKEIKKHLEKQLVVLIDKVIERMKKKNFKSAGGLIKQGLMDSFVDVEDIKKGIPDYATAIMKEMTSSRMEKQIKGMLKEKVDQYVQKTFDVQDDKRKDLIVSKSGVPGEDAARKKIRNVLTHNQQVIDELSLLIIILATLIFLFEVFNKGPIPQTQYILMSLSLLVLLLCGITTPMIDLEAKISELTFVLFDHPITFKDQVLFFQSKSILNVFSIMIHHKDFLMNVVGVLLVSFSVIFPVLKFLSSLAYYYDYAHARQNKFVQFFVHKAGKWSMADVLVVAMFMAFIGFNGIIDGQLDKLRKSSEGISMLTTNGTNLQPGFYLFLAYTILAMFLSGFLKLRPYQCNPAASKEEDEKSNG